MAKIKVSNPGCSNMLKNVGRVKKESPDTKSRRTSGQGLKGAKGKLDKKKVGPNGKKKKKNTKGKSNFSSEYGAKCDWCGQTYSRWVILLSRSRGSIVYIADSAIS